MKGTSKNAADLWTSVATENRRSNVERKWVKDFKTQDKQEVMGRRAGRKVISLRKEKRDLSVSVVV